MQRLRGTFLFLNLWSIGRQAGVEPRVPCVGGTASSLLLGSPYRSMLLLRATSTRICRQLDGSSDVVTAQLTAMLASLLKRGWLESTKEDRNVFFAELEKHSSLLRQRSSGKEGLG